MYLQGSLGAGCPAEAVGGWPRWLVLTSRDPVPLSSALPVPAESRRPHSECPQMNVEAAWEDHDPHERFSCCSVFLRASPQAFLPAEAEPAPQPGGVACPPRTVFPSLCLQELWDLSLVLYMLGFF